MNTQITKYSDLIALAASNNNRECCLYDSFDALTEELNVTLDYAVLGTVSAELEDRLQLSPLNTWYCSSWVGLYAYYLDNELIGFSYLPYSKAKPIFRWISRELAIKLKKAIYEVAASFEVLTIHVLDDSPIDPEWIRERTFHGYWD